MPRAVIVAVPVPTVTLIDEELLAPDQPPPVTCHEKDVAPADVAEKTPVEPAHNADVEAMEGVGGMTAGIFVKVNGEPAPHGPLATTVIVAVVVPAIRFIELDVLLPLQPAPVTTQV